MSLAFQNCTGLTNVKIPNTVTNIGGHTFQGCTNLTSITIPESVTFIGDYTFYGCTRLTMVTFQGGNVNYFGDFSFDEYVLDNGLAKEYQKAGGGIGTYMRTSYNAGWTKQ